MRGRSHDRSQRARRSNIEKRCGHRGGLQYRFRQVSTRAHNETSVTRRPSAQRRLGMVFLVSDNMAATLTVSPPGPVQRYPGSLLISFRRDPLGFLMRLARDYGDVVHFKLSNQSVYLINHPDYIRDILVTNNRIFHKSRGLEMAKRFLGEGLLTSEDDFHRRQRQLAQPAFHRDRIAAYGSVMADYAARACERWTDGDTLDLQQEMMRLTLAIVGKTLFDADVESEAHEIREALTEIMHLFTFSLTLPYAELIEKLILPRHRRFQRARARLDSTIYRIIEERRASSIDRGDLLSMLLLARDEEANGDGSGMSDLQVRDEAM